MSRAHTARQICRIFVSLDLSVVEGVGKVADLRSAGLPTSFGKQAAKPNNTPSVEPRASKKANTGIYHALKLVIYSDNGVDGVKIYSHQRNNARGGNLDIHGVFMNPGESLGPSGGWSSLHRDRAGG